MELFANIERSRAEISTIELFVSKYHSAKEQYKHQDYQSASDTLIYCGEILVPFDDILPKCKVAYLLMKSLYKSNQFNHCKRHIGILTMIIEGLEYDSPLYIKAKMKSYIYDCLSSYILNDLNESIQIAIDSISYMKSNHFTCSQRAIMFWVFLKAFLREGRLNKTKQFALFKEYYDRLRATAKERNEVNRVIRDAYKTLMSSKSRNVLFEKFNKIFYMVKYNKDNNEEKVLRFLDANISTYVRGDHFSQLKQVFEGFAVINKIDLNDKWEGMTMREIMNEQRIRLKSFDVIFANVCGAVNALFAEFYIENKEILPQVAKNDEGNNSKFIKVDSSLYFNSNDGCKEESKDALMVKMKTMKNKNQVLTGCSSFRVLGNNNKYKTNTKLLIDYHRNSSTNNSGRPLKLVSSGSCQNINSVIIQHDHKPRIMLGNAYNDNSNSNSHSILLPKGSSMQKNASLSNIHSSRTVYGKYLRKSILENKPMDIQGKSKINIIDNNNDDDINNKLTLSQLQLQMQLQLNTEKNSPITPITEKQFVLRNINNYLHNILIEHFHKNPPLSTKDLISTLSLPSYIKDHHTSSKENTLKFPIYSNQDKSFFYSNFLLIKNFFLFGICDGHGKFGKHISEAVSSLFPANLFYLIIDNNIMKRNANLNETIISLFNLIEKPNVKDMNILKYFTNKFNMDYTDISFVKNSLEEIKNEVKEAIARTHNDCKAKKKLDINDSGCCLCSLMVYGAFLYIINVGDSRCVLGTHCFDENRWIAKQLTKDHKPGVISEAKRILALGGRVQQEDKHGLIKVLSKEMHKDETGLYISRSIGDDSMKNIGVSYEADFYRIDLDSNDKIVILASNGLWKIITNEDAINLCGYHYSNGHTAEKASNELLNLAISKVKPRTKKSPRRYDDLTCSVIFFDVK